MKFAAAFVGACAILAAARVSGAALASQKCTKDDKTCSGMAAEAAAGAATRKVGNLNIVPIINGLWQNSRPTVSTDRMVQAMRKYSAAGFNTWDGADIYGPSEELMGLHGKGTV